MNEIPARPPSRRISHIARSSLIIAIFFAVDKALGLLRQVFIGRQFGIGPELDVFNAANNLPDLLFALISGGALSIAFIPVLAEAFEHDGRAGLWQLFSRVANLAFVITALFAMLIALLAEPLVSAEAGIAPGFSPDRQALVANLMRLNLIATMLFSLSGLVSAGLQSNQHFLLPALAPVLYDLGQIFGALVLAPEQGYQIGSFTLPAMGFGIHGLVYGVILGAALHFAIQIPGLVRYKFQWSPSLTFRHPAVLKVARLMGPRIINIGAFQLIFVVQDNLASRLDAGSITALAYGWLIMQVPETIIGTAIGIAILPTLAAQFARGDEAGFQGSVSRAIRILSALMIPVGVLMMVVIRPLVQSAFQFSAAGTELVVWAARAYLLGLVGHSVLEIAARAYYARQDARTPLLAASLNALLFISLSALLYRSLGAPGIALSNSIAFSLEALLLLVLLERRFPGVSGGWRTVLRPLAGALSAALMAQLVISILPLASFFSALLAFALGALAALPFVWRETRQLIHL